MSDWKLVPVEPTPEMVEAGKDERMRCFDTHGRETSPVSVGEALTRTYTAMLAAAPHAAYVPADELRELVEKWLAEYPHHDPVPVLVRCCASDLQALLDRHCKTEAQEGSDE